MSERESGMKPIVWRHARIPDYRWYDTTCGFDCPHCGEEVVLAEPEDAWRCDCGRLYRMVVRVEEGTEE